MILFWSESEFIDHHILPWWNSRNAQLEKERSGETDLAKRVQELETENRELKKEQASMLARFIYFTQQCEDKNPIVSVDGLIPSIAGSEGRTLVLHKIVDDILSERPNMITNLGKQQIEAPWFTHMMIYCIVCEPGLTTLRTAFWNKPSKSAGDHQPPTFMDL